MIAPGRSGMSGFWELVHLSPKHPSFVGESVGSAIQQQTSQQSSLLESLSLASGVSHEHS